MTISCESGKQNSNKEREKKRVIDAHKTGIDSKIIPLDIGPHLSTVRAFLLQTALHTNKYHTINKACICPGVKVTRNLKASINVQEFLQQHKEKANDRLKEHGFLHTLCSRPFMNG